MEKNRDKYKDDENVAGWINYSLDLTNEAVKSKLDG